MPIASNTLQKNIQIVLRKMKTAYCAFELRIVRLNCVFKLK